MGKIKEQICIDQDLYLFLVKIQTDRKMRNMSQTLNYFLRYSVNKIGDIDTVRAGMEHQLRVRDEKIKNLEYALKTVKK